MRQIERQAVAHVRAGVEIIPREQQQCFTDARLEIEMPAENAAAERAGDENAVARPRAVALHGAAFRDRTEHGDANR